MTKMKTCSEIRHENLLKVIERTGSLQEVADRLDKSHAQISQLKTQAKHSKSGKPRVMGDEIARLIEEKFELEYGWMDNVHQDASTAAQTKEQSPLVATDMINWRDRARTRMKELGISQEHLGESIGMTPAGIQKWLAGDHQPSLDQIVQIANILGVTQTWLTCGIDANSTIDGIDGKPHVILQRLIELARTRRLRSEQWEALGAMVTAFDPAPLESAKVKSTSAASKNGTTG